jgi:regulatory protein
VSREQLQDSDQAALQPPDPPANPESVARTICLSMLEKQPRSRFELATALRRRGVPDVASTTVLDRFTELGLVDDAALAEAFAQARHSNRSQAGMAIAAQLRRRGIEDSVIRDALQKLDPEAEKLAAHSLAQSRLSRMDGLDTPTRVRRLMALLGRRGYSSEVAAQAVRDALAAGEEFQDVVVLADVD